MLFHWIRKPHSIDRIATRIACSVRLARAERQVSRDPGQVGPRMQLAEALAAAGRDEEALELLKTLANELARAGQTRKAMAVLHRSRRLCPQAREVEARVAELQAVADVEEAADRRRRAAAAALNGPLVPRRVPSHGAAPPARSAPPAPVVAFELDESPAERYHARPNVRGRGDAA